MIKKIGINTVIVGGDGEELRKLIKECKRLGLKYKVVHQAMMKHGENPKDTIIRYAKLKGE